MSITYFGNLAEYQQITAILAFQLESANKHAVRIRRGQLTPN